MRVSELGELVKAVRNSAGFTAIGFARKVGTSESLIRQIEKGRRYTLPHNVVMKMCDEFEGLDREYVYQLNKEPERKNFDKIFPKNYPNLPQDRAIFHGDEMAEEIFHVLRLSLKVRDGTGLDMWTIKKLKKVMAGWKTFKIMNSAKGD